MKCLTLTTPDNEKIEIHMLNVGEQFAGFGGSKHALIVGSDFGSGRRDRKPTASMITRRTSGMGLHDTERDIHDATMWRYLVKLINGEIKATAALSDELATVLKSADDDR